MLANYTIYDARNALHLDEGDNDELVCSLVEALPDYIEQVTGMTQAQQETEPLIKTVGNFIVELWYYGTHTDDVKLNRTINSLLKVLTFKAQRYEGESSDEGLCQSIL